MNKGWTLEFLCKHKIMLLCNCIETASYFLFSASLSGLTLFIFFILFKGWLALLTSCFIYNAWAIPLRQFFKIYHQPQHYAMWFCFDYLADLVYILDIVLFKYRVMFMKNGFWVKDRKELGKKLMFLMSCFTLHS